MGAASTGTASALQALSIGRDSSLSSGIRAMFGVLALFLTLWSLRRSSPAPHRPI